MILTLLLVIPFLGAYALSQPNENSDDDDFGNGDGGMMQPVAATGAI
ncbi:MAG: hypothetical protein K0U28_04660 [Cyanobacteria bacterium]|nr:hypothetical protein [Cyanobacteriota bacterium]